MPPPPVSHSVRGIGGGDTKFFFLPWCLSDKKVTRGNLICIRFRKQNSPLTLLRVQVCNLNPTFPRSESRTGYIVDFAIFNIVSNLFNLVCDVRHNFENIFSIPFKPGICIKYKQKEKIIITICRNILLK